MTINPVAFDLSAGFHPEVHEIKTHPALKRGLKRTFYRIDPSHKHPEERLIFLVNGLVVLDGILFHIQKVYRDNWVKMEAQMILDKEAIVEEVSLETGLVSKKKAKELLADVIGKSSAFIHTDEDLRREIKTIKLGMMPFFENLNRIWNQELAQQTQEIFFRSIENIYDEFYKTKVMKRSIIFRSLKSLMISSFYETTRLMQPQVAQMIAVEYGEKIGEKGDWSRFQHSLGLTLFTLKEPITASLLALLSNPSDVFKFLSTQMSYQIVANPKDHDLVICLDESNTPLYAGFILDGTQRMVRYYIIEITNEAKESLYLCGGDHLQSSTGRGNSISLGNHYALMVNLPIDRICVSRVAKMVFFQKR